MIELPKFDARVFIVHLGGLGDLVLLAEGLSALRTRYPDAHVILACREPFASVVGLYAARPDEVVPIALNPYEYGQLDEGMDTRSREQLATATREGIDVFIDATLRPTWFGRLLGHRIAAPISFSPLGSENERLIARLMRIRLGLVAARIQPLADEQVHERERYQRLFGPLQPRRTLVLTEQDAEQSKALLASLHLEEHAFVASFVSGSPSTLYKRWPTRHYLTVLQQSAGGLPVLFVGDEAERQETAEVVAEARAKGIRAESLIGSSPSLPAIAGVLAKARAYLGNDTGLSHLASALGVAGVSVHGGGAWPRYSPWASGSIGVVHPLPCFGCFWDCAFEHGYCVDRISPRSVERALLRVLAEPHAPPAAITVQTLRGLETEIIQEASQTFRKAQADREGRLRVIRRLRQLLERRRQHLAR